MTTAPWSALSGVFTVRLDESLCEIGRTIYHGGEPAEGLGGEGLTVVTRFLLLVATTPWRLAWVNLLDGDDYIPAGASIDQPTSNGEDFLEVRPLLDPSPLKQLVDLPAAGRFRVPGPPVEEDLFLVPGLVALSADYYEAERDEELGILTSWRAVIRGAVAKEMTLEPTWFER